MRLCNVLSQNIFMCGESDISISVAFHSSARLKRILKFSTVNKCSHFLSTLAGNEHQRRFLIHLQSGKDGKKKNMNENCRERIKFSETVFPRLVS